MSKEKTRNSRTMTESAFWSMIRSCLRRLTITWKPRNEAIQSAKRLYFGDNKRQRFEYLCSECQMYFSRKEVEADHIVPCGTLSSGEDLCGFIQRAFPEKEGWQVLCHGCHSVKTNRTRTGAQ